jgi:predicted lactoylglutathione lyase
MIFVNLAVRDLAKAKAFYTAIAVIRQFELRHLRDLK